MADGAEGGKAWEGKSLESLESRIRAALEEEYERRFREREEELRRLIREGTGVDPDALEARIEAEAEIRAAAQVQRIRAEMEAEFQARLDRAVREVKASVPASRGTTLLEELDPEERKWLEDYLRAEIAREASPVPSEPEVESTGVEAHERGPAQEGGPAGHRGKAKQKKVRKVVRTGPVRTSRHGPRIPETEPATADTGEEEAGKHPVPGDIFDVYISEKALRKIVHHALKYSAQEKEVMGFMVGDQYHWEGRTYTVCRDVVTTELDASLVSVRFKREGFAQLFDELDNLGFDYILIGWYHSHPGHTCFLSSTDINTQKTMFNQPFHSGLVVDPINEEIKVFGVEGSDYYEKSYAVFREGSFAY